MSQGRESADRGAKVEDRGIQLVSSWTMRGLDIEQVEMGWCISQVSPEKQIQI